jgi:SAM-dependent methyltransferase
MSGTFDAYYENPNYLLYKRVLFNYLLRKRMVARQLGECQRPALDIGSGVAPMLEGPDVLLSDMSLAGMRVMRAEGRRCCVLDIQRLGLRSASVKTIVCSEVLEHVPDDQAAMVELARVLSPGGRLILTVPLHGYYWSVDDDEVGHFRRYSRRDMKAKISQAGLRLRRVRRVGSVFERALTIGAVLIYRTLAGRDGQWRKRPGRIFIWANRATAWALQGLARLSPMAACSVGLFDCVKE